MSRDEQFRKIRGKKKKSIPLINNQCEIIFFFFGGVKGIRHSKFL